ncbi:hypothetical protein [Leifsonia sp. Leaf264]|uniref:hypothetical protein n=1 Tax=Leifsonia sp. Leaf264 TaxID=1736314 RepID=UPI0006F5D93D|nr:hypothetical protein [Leifsonia sp. Leaf264]KQO98393.1 hypothetical protein ASF30_10050 [Leifsonia sp. Leaf264]
MTDLDPFVLAGQHPADRLLEAQKLSSPVYLHGDPAPTRNQVAAVLHALADHTHNEHMLGDAVAELGADRANLGPAWAQVTGLGRYFQRLGDYVEWYDRDPSVVKLSPAATILAEQLAEKHCKTVDDVISEAVIRHHGWFAPAEVTFSLDDIAPPTDLDGDPIPTSR